MRRLALIALVLAALAEPVHAQTSAAVQQLVENARYWQGRGREDKAIEAWGKVLAAEPASPEALVALTLHHARLDQIPQAREYLGRLKEAHPAHAEIPRLERALELGKRWDTVLAEARSLVRAGRVDEGIARYRELFAGGDPPQEIALEYLQTLGGTPRGWEPARAGLERLAKQRPNDTKVQVALAKHLTYREPTRLEGIKQLEQLAGRRGHAAEANAAWREALTWLPSVPANEPLFTAFLQKNPNDRVIANKRAQATLSEQRANTLEQAYDALNRKDSAEAARLFEAAGDKDPDALAGRAILLLQQERFAEARQLLERAKALAPKRPQVWEKPLKTATFWSLLREAQTDMDAGRSEAAEKKLLRAIQTSPEERLHADRMLATLYLTRGDLKQSEARLERVLKAEPDNPDALREQVEVLLRTDRYEEAIDRNRRLMQLAPDKAYPEAALSAELLRTRAALSRSRGNLARAREQLIGASELDPSNFWVQHDLANLLLETHDLAQARVVADRLVALRPQELTAQVTRVRVLVAQDHIDEALDALRALPAAARTDEFVKLERRLELQKQVLALVERLRAGGVAGTRQELLELELRVESQPDLVPVVAGAWSSLGDNERSIQLMKRVLEKHPKSSAGLRLQLAAVLFRSGRDDEVLTTLEAISRDETLTPLERQGLESLRVAAAVRRADRRREEGDLTGALQQLQPVAKEFPNNGRVLCALGRIFEQGDSPEDAHAAFSRALEQNADDHEARAGAASALLDLGRNDEARRLVDDALARTPDEPLLYLLSGRIAARSGDDARASEHLRKGLRLARPKEPRSQTPEPPATLTAHTSTDAMLRVAMSRYSGEPALPDDARPAPKSLLRELDEELAIVESRHLVVLSPGLTVRRREGEAGLGSLTELGLPLSASVPVGYLGRLSFVMTPTLMDSGVPQENLASLALRYGSGVTAPSGQNALALGTGLALRFDNEWLHADVGTSPLGFRFLNVVGGVEWRPRLGPIGFALEASRRLVTDSLLSSAGAYDGPSGRWWGGVTRTGARLEVNWSRRSNQLYGFGEAGYLQGTNVADNSQVQAGVGGHLMLARIGSQELLLGGNAIYLGYRRNLRYFTIGHGGYFSPQAFMHLGVPFTWWGEGLLRWKLVAEPGLNWFHENPAPTFPTDGAMQEARLAQVGKDGEPVFATYSARTSTGFALNVEGEASYRFGPALELAGSIRFHTAADYQEFIAALALRFGVKPAWR